MYTAYYSMRGDGDGELVAVFSDTDTNPLTDDQLEFLMTAMQLQMNAELGEIGIGWFVQHSGDCDFPSIWDNHPKRTAKEYEPCFSLDFSFTDEDGNDFHLVRSFLTETKELACQEALNMQRQLQKAYPRFRGVSIRGNEV
jgi:hypothetical protein